MSRSKACARCAELEREVARWRQDYKDLATAIAKRDGYTATAPNLIAFPPEPESQKLPPEVWGAIERTTFAASEERKDAIEAARGLLEVGTAPEEIVRQIEAGESVEI